MKEGETFESDTDTEVIPTLCKFLYRWVGAGLDGLAWWVLAPAKASGCWATSLLCLLFCHSAALHPTALCLLLSFLFTSTSTCPPPIPLPQLVCEVVKQLEGAYALIIKSAVYPGELVACRRGSPLILGMKYGIQVGAALCMLGWAGLVGGGGQWLGGRCSWRSGRLSAVHQTACAWWVPYDRQSACSYLALPPPPGCSPAVLEPPRPAGRRHAPHPPQPLHPAHPQDDRLLCPRAPVL